VTSLLTTAQVAEWLNVSRAYVYEHADELGAERLGTGPKARLRFDAAVVEQSLSRPALAVPAETSMVKRRARKRQPNDVELLPIRVREAA
jgi:excisionase family DNA binding protein